MEGFIVTGYGSFLAKYIQYEFKLTTAFSGIYTGETMLKIVKIESKVVPHCSSNCCTVIHYYEMMTRVAMYSSDEIDEPFQQEYLGPTKPKRSSIS